MRRLFCRLLYALLCRRFPLAVVSLVNRLD